jgi:hypothetical protein
LANRTGNEYTDAIFWTLVETQHDAAEMLASRRKMKVHLARYLHLGTTDEDMGWGKVLVTELRAIYQELVDVLKDEGPKAGMEQ